ncbi:thiamine pyrophosphate-binding protein [Actinoallomurus sp. NPDC050550]|uniref:thiamine pyrophosphate-binding protein n=1 Tax=Actinoallomurus sp. NPDC050550 TaxID=3154937 RepID=UPI0033CC0696
MSDLNGAHALVRTLVDSGVGVCFGNPGTSEMHFVAALDTVPAMRGVLCLHEGVATGAADGYGRMAGRPAAALLHLGPGLANGIANLHNARRAHSPVLTIVGDHATSPAARLAPAGRHRRARPVGLLLGTPFRLGRRPRP